VICKTWRLLNRVMHEDALGRLQQERHSRDCLSSGRLGPQVLCDEVLYEMMSCGGMMVHAGASEPSLHRDCWPICCRSSEPSASSGSRTGDAAAHAQSQRDMPGRAAQSYPSARPGQRLQYARPFHCTHAQSRAAAVSRAFVTRMRCARLSRGPAASPRQVHTRVDNAQVGSLAADGCTVHGQILRLLAPTAHGLSKVNAHQLRKVHGRCLKVAVDR
jgi:hypothetical protein